MYISLAYIPNFITSIRFLLTAPTIWALFKGRIELALSLFLIAALTDWLDGWLARRYSGWASEWGAFLDPLADKVLLVSVFIASGYLNYLPLWVVAVAVGRDIAITLGIFIYHLWIGPLHYSPIYSSKINTGLQVSLVVLLLVQKTLWCLPDLWIQINSIVMAATSVISFMQYATIWVSKVRHHVKTLR